MEPADRTVEILKGIREETRKTHEEVSSLRTELVDRIERVERRQAETEIRLATELVSVGSAVREVRDLLREDRGLRQQVDDHERRLSAVERRTG